MHRVFFSFWYIWIERTHISRHEDTVLIENGKFILFLNIVDYLPGHDNSLLRRYCHFRTLFYLSIALHRRHRYRTTRRVTLPCRQDLYAVRCDQKGMFYQKYQHTLCTLRGQSRNLPNCAVLFPSCVALVQSSGHVLSLCVPSVIIGSMVKHMPSFASPTALFLA
jgi:hypothetical protein